jgi:hypothetical protein
MSNSYVLLEKIVVPAAGASSVTFANIPQTGYTDLLLKISVRSDRASSTWDNSQLSINGSTANMSGRLLRGNGSTASSSTLTSFTIGDIPAVNATASTFASQEVYIPNYAGSTNKSASVDSVGENNATNAVNDLFANLWSQTTAINQLNVFSGNSANFVANSTFYLYGVAKLGTTPTIAPKATGGDVIDTDGTYWYHIFRSSGTFTPATALTCDYLVVAGGGGGGSRWGGGGGAGGFRTDTGLSLATSTNYTVTVGAGGAGGAGAAYNRGATGSNSVLATITSTGGGGGGTGSSQTPTTGGSGGGGGFFTQSGAAGTAGQGSAGGNAWTTSQYAGGGGGGASAVGSNAPSGDNGGNGGAGTSSSYTGSAVTYAGGGGGGCENGTPGTGGSGGGGAGAKTAGTGTAGTANRGGGGGGGGNDTGTGGAGGSGIVVVRYLVA